MPSTTTLAFASIFVLASIVAGYVYVFGIPPEMKRKLEKQALQTMGEVGDDAIAMAYALESMSVLTSVFSRIKRPT